MTLTVREVKKPKVQVEFRDKTPINIKQGIETLKEISADFQNKRQKNSWDYSLSR